MNNKIGLFIIGFLLLISIVAAGALGVLAFSLNTRLTDTQAQLKDVQGKHTALQSTYDALTAENTQTKSDLEQSQAQVKKLEDDLKAAEEQSTALTAKLDKVLEKVELLDSFWGYDFGKFESNLQAANDDVLSQEYNDWVNTPSGSDESFNAYESLIAYLIQSIGEAAK